MRSKLKLLLKDNSKIVYAYSCDESIDTIDGEIEYSITKNDFKLKKHATNDEDGFVAEWLYPHIYKVIFKENCPKERYIITG